MVAFQGPRRRMLTAAPGALIAGAVFRPARAQPARKTFVLVHGSFCGGWIWRRVTDRLEQQGHKVFVVTLTGLGDRSHLLRKDIDLDTHIADVVNLIKWESLDNVSLVSWSYAGFIGAGALETMGDRVSSVVWLDAFLPANGQRVMDLTTFGKAAQAAAEKGDAGFGPPPNMSDIFVAERDQAFALSKVTAHPVGTYLQPIKLAGALDKVAKKTYIRLPKFPAPSFDKALADCKNDKSWATFVLPDVGHMAMLDAPDRVSELITQAS
jgi:pimeloyl-ACP methyl ester carboxylesterase